MEPLFQAAIVVIILLLTAILVLKYILDARRAELMDTRRELQALQQEHARAYERFTALMSVTSDSLIILDANSRVVFLNAAAQTLFGVDEGRGLRLDELGWAYELHSVVKGARTFAVRVRPLRTGADRGVLIGLNEITELQRLGRARREFVANISHELRTPVTSLHLLADTLSGKTLKDREFSEELIGKIRAQVDLLHQLTDELMDLALIESGQAPIKLIETRAVELANEAVEPLRPQLERKGIALTLQVPDDLIVLADPQAIRKVLGNLIHNAIKFTNSGGRIAVRALAHGENVEFAIEDNGCGIAAKDLPRIFERFYKADRARARQPGELRGTGLGLAIAKHMVEAHGGQIRAESVEGQGATFYFTLPAAN